MQASTAEFRRGLKIELDGNPYTIVDFQHVKPGKGGAFVRTKLKNMISGAVLEHTFKSGEKLEKADIEERQMQYLYPEGDQYVFMDTSTYNQLNFNKEQLGDTPDYLVDGMMVDVLFWSEKPIGVVPCTSGVCAHPVDRRSAMNRPLSELGYVYAIRGPFAPSASWNFALPPLVQYQRAVSRTRPAAVSPTYRSSRSA